MTIYEIVTGLEISRTLLSVFDSLLIFLGALTGISVTDKKITNKVPRTDEEDENAEA